MSNLAENLTRSAAAKPEKLALRMDEVTYTWKEFDAAASKFAGYLKAQGIQPGDFVGICLPDTPNFAITAYGVWRAGAAVLPMNPLNKSRELEYYLSDSGAKLVVGLAGGDLEKTAAKKNVPFVDGLSDLSALPGEPVTQDEPRDDSDLAVLIYTSGTTGRPKGAELTHGSMNSNREVNDRTLAEAGEHDVTLGCLPFFHVFGLTCNLNTTVGSSTTLTLLPRFDPRKVLQIIERDKVTIFQGVPTMFQALLEVADEPEMKDIDTSSLRVAFSGGSPMPVDTFHRFEKRFNVTILEGYGLSECSPVVASNHPHRPRKPGSIGIPIEGAEVKLFDQSDNEVADGEVGEIVVRGPMLFKGYWNKPEATAESMRGGWFHTGDLARRDADGDYFIVDRAKDMIIRGGYNVYPREVEEALYEHPDIVEAAVVGIPDEHYGEEVVAYVSLRKGSTLDEDGIKAFAKERVAAYKYPRIVHIIDELPKGATGKILKRELPHRG